jgi:hypothetical protein
MPGEISRRRDQRQFGLMKISPSDHAIHNINSGLHLKHQIKSDINTDSKIIASIRRDVNSGSAGIGILRFLRLPEFCRRPGNPTTIRFPLIEIPILRRGMASRDVRRVIPEKRR